MTEEVIEYIKVLKPSRKVEFLVHFIKSIRMSGYGLVRWSKIADDETLKMSLKHLLSEWDLGENEIELIMLYMQRNSYQPNQSILDDYGNKVHSVQDLMGNILKGSDLGH
jgi:hypothetical protein